MKTQQERLEERMDYWFTEQTKTRDKARQRLAKYFVSELNKVYVELMGEDYTPRRR